MTVDQIRTILQQERAKLDTLGVAELCILGSQARGEAGPRSDIDVLARFSSTPTWSRFMDLKFLLEDQLEASVDLVTQPALRPELRARIMSEAVRGS